MRYLLYRLHKLWGESNDPAARPKAYVFLGRANPVQARVLESWGITPLVSEADDIGEGLREFLARLLRAAREPRPGANATA